MFAATFLPHTPAKIVYLTFVHTLNSNELPTSCKVFFCVEKITILFPKLAGKKVEQQKPKTFLAFLQPAAKNHTK